MPAGATTTLLEQVNNLPTIPKVVQDLLLEFDRSNVEVDRVSRLVGSDPVIATRLLRLANSAFYRRSGLVSRVQDAVIFLGMNAVRNLVLSAGLASSVSFPVGFPRELFWRYSLHTAVAARYCANRFYLDPETAFTIGLIRAIGEPLMYGVIGAEMRELDLLTPFYDIDRPAFERRKLGFSGVDLAADLAERWHFPKPLTEALRQSQTPQDSEANFKMAAVVYLGAWMAGEIEAGADVQADVGASPEIGDLMRRIGFKPSMLTDMPPIAEQARGLEMLVG